MKEPARLFLLKGGKGSKRPTGALTDLTSNEQTPTISRSAKKKAKRNATLANLRNELEEAKKAKTSPGGGKGGAGGGGPKGGGKGDHPKKDARGRFVTDRSGTNICYAFGSGKCNGVCPKGFAHVCQWCLGNHMTKDHKGGHM